MSQQPSNPKAAPAWISAATRDWPTYFDRVAGGEPRQTLLDALAAFEADPAPTPSGPRATREAIDLGCGEGRDTAELLRRDWTVLAIDGHPDGIARLVNRPDLQHLDRLTLQLRGFEGIDRLPRCDLLNASFALPFCPPAHFEALWRALRACIRPGGRFAGQLFGDRDTWATIEDRSHFTRADAERLFEGMQLERFDEEEREGTDASDQHKHWHVFHVVAREPHRTSR